MPKQQLTVSLVFAVVFAMLVLGLNNATPNTYAKAPAAPKALITPWSVKGNKITATNFLGTKNNQPLVFKTHKVERMRLDTNGNVGIGTNNPSRSLQIVSTNAIVRLDSNASNGIAQTEYATDARRYYTGVFGSTAGVLAGKYYIKDDNTGQSRLVIDTSGNIGIGTTNPQAKIHVANTSGEGLRVQGPASGAANGAYVSWTDSSGTAIGYVGDASSGDTDTYLTSYVSRVHLYTPFGAVLTAGTNGNVGIAMTNPDARLHIRSDGNDINYLVRAENPSGDLLFGVRNSGALYFTPGGGTTTAHVCYQNTVTAVKYLVQCSSAAEYVPAIDGGTGYPESADLVSIAPAVKNPYGDAHGPFAVQKSSTPCDNKLLGFIVKPESGASGVKLNDHYLPLAIYGYFPAKVTMENGAIKRGDPITSSNKAGYGMRATSACKVIGYALEDANADGTIQVFANFGENSASEVVALRQENRALKEQLTAIEARLAALEQNSPSTINNSSEFTVARSITETGKR